MIVELNPDQQLAAESVDGDFVTIAGPGSGKTAVLIQRYIRMITTLGIKSSDILNLTFTNSAATEMVKRVGLFDAEKVFRTFHSFALDLLKREAQYLPFPVTETIIPVYGEDRLLMKDLMKIYPAITTYRSLADKLSEWKSSNIEPDQAIEEGYNRGTEFWYAQAYKDYEKKCREQGWLDFDSLMKETVKLLETNDEVRTRNKWKYIAVDECQDTDVVQFKLLKLIYGGNIFVVGDENQLIYEWRSAQAGNLSAFGQVFPRARKLYLGKNYRSTQRLVAFFKRILPVDNGIASHLESMREEGTDPVITRFSDEYEELSVVLRQIKDAGNTTIIARTNRQLLAFQRLAMARDMKSHILGKKDLWQQTEVKTLLDLLKKEQDDPRPAHEVMKDLLERHNLMHRYRNTGSANEKDPIENLMGIVKMAANRGTPAEFLTWLRKLTYATKKKEPTLTLTTVHQAKGREWKHVFVVGARQGMMPHKDGELLEEHRIFYVACTRAADTLNISFYGNHSQFLNDFQEEIIDHGEKESEGNTDQ